MSIVAMVVLLGYPVLQAWALWHLARQMPAVSFPDWADRPLDLPPLWRATYPR